MYVVVGNEKSMERKKFFYIYIDKFLFVSCFVILFGRRLTENECNQKKKSKKK